MEAFHNNKFLRERRKELRKNATPQEIILWSRIRNENLGFRFCRQYSIGPYIADFYCPKKKLIVEVDGSQHLDNKEYDDERTKYFNLLGYKILRFWNNEINTNIDGVLQEIITEIQSSPNPSLSKEGRR